MPRSTATIPSVLVLTLLPLLSACDPGEEPIRAYTAPRPTEPPEDAANALSSAPAALDMSGGERGEAPEPAPGGGPASDEAGHLHWDAPEGWSQRRGGASMRLATISPNGGGGPEIAVSRFGPEMGGVQVNVNRWRRELGLSPVDQATAEQAASPIQGTAVEGRLIDIASDTQRTLVAWLDVDGQQWFFKLSGAIDTVTQAEPALMSIVQSAEIHRGSHGPPTNAAPTATATPPAPGNNPAAPPTGQGSPPAPMPTAGTFTAAGMTGPIPQGWTATENPDDPILAELTPTGAGEMGIALTVTRMPGNAGGELANVNRWREQVGLDPIASPAEQDGVPGLEIDGRPTRMYRVFDTQGAPTDHGILVARIDDAGQTWFVKLDGPAQRVASLTQTYLDIIARLDLPE